MNPMTWWASLLLCILFGVLIVHVMVLVVRNLLGIRRDMTLDQLARDLSESARVTKRQGELTERQQQDIDKQTAEFTALNSQVRELVIKLAAKQSETAKAVAEIKEVVSPTTGEFPSVSAKPE